MKTFHKLTDPSKRGAPAVAQAAQVDRGPPQPAVDTRAVVEAIGAIFFNTINHRWLSASDIAQALRDSFDVVDTALKGVEHIRFTIMANELMVNGVTLTADTRSIDTFLKHLPRLGVNSLSLKRGLTREEFNGLIDVMCEEPITLEEMGGFSTAFAKGGFLHIESHKIQLREVTDDQTVVSREALEAMSPENREQAASDVRTLLAGEGSGPADAAQAKALSVFAEDTGGLADLVMEVATGKKDPASDDPEATAEQVIDCLKRTFDALMDDPASKSQKGKKAIARTFRELETELLARLPGGAGDAASQAVVDAVGQMQETLKMDAIAGDYVKRLKALADSEKHILRFIKAQGLDSVRSAELAEILGEGGLDVSGWHRLLARSGAGDAALAEEPLDETANAVGRLALLLDRLGDDLPAAGGRNVVHTPGKVAEDILAVRHEVAAAVESTKSKITGLVKAVEQDQVTVAAMEKAAREKGVAPTLTRQRLLVVLAEAVQELCQPLSVINCSVSMVVGRALGDITPAQEDMLNLATEGMAKMQILIASLEKIAGSPAGLTPDRKIQASLLQKE